MVLLIGFRICSWLPFSPRIAKYLLCATLYRGGPWSQRVSQNKGLMNYSSVQRLIAIMLLSSYLGIMSHHFINYNEILQKVYGSAKSCIKYNILILDWLKLILARNCHSKFKIQWSPQFFFLLSSILFPAVAVFRNCCQFILLT